MTVRTVLHTLSTSPKLIAKGVGSTTAAPTVAIVSAPSAEIYVGGVDVTAANGTPVAITTGQLRVDLGPDDELYAIASAATPTVRVFTTRAGYVA
jgi:hypothetical protein